MSFCVILGSAFAAPVLAGRELKSERIRTPEGDVTLYRAPAGRDAFVLFRHGLPHSLLPNQIPFKAHALALREIACQALLITSSVGVLDPQLPLNKPMLAGDLLMTENRLPDGSACTLFTEPSAEQGHLVVEDGIFSSALGDEVERLAGGSVPRVVFAYVGGPRTKTAAENRALRATGAQVNSMTVGPEAVLANELDIPVAALLVGHKHSGGRDADMPRDASSGLAQSLVDARHGTEQLAWRFLAEAHAVPFANRLYRFGAAHDRA